MIVFVSVFVPVFVSVFLFAYFFLSIFQLGWSITLNYATFYLCPHVSKSTSPSMLSTHNPKKTTQGGEARTLEKYDHPTGTIVSLFSILG